MESSQIEAVISSRMADYLAAWRGLDVDRIAGFYIDSPQFRVYADGEVMDREALVSLVADLCDSLQSIDGKWEPLEITPLGDGIALAGSRFTRVLTDNEGNVMRDWGTGTWVWTLQDGEWLLIHRMPGTCPRENQIGEALPNRQLLLARSTVRWHTACAASYLARSRTANR